MAGPTKYENSDGEMVPYDDLSDAERDYYDQEPDIDLQSYVRNWGREESGLDMDDEGNWVVR